MGGSFYLVIVGPNDKPVYELEFGTQVKDKSVEKVRTGLDSNLFGS
jgi:hypothetical protein